MNWKAYRQTGRSGLEHGSWDIPAPGNSVAKMRWPNRIVVSALVEARKAKEDRIRRVSASGYLKLAVRRIRRVRRRDVPVLERH